MKLLVAYIALLSVQVPFNIMYLFTFLLSDIEAVGKQLGVGYIIIAALYFTVLGIIGILIILQSFKSYRQKDIDYCLKGLMVLKYGMVPYFIVNFLAMTALALLFAVASRGTVIFAAPFLLPIAMFFTWLAMLPSSFFGVQVVRLCSDEGKIGKSKPWHMLFQFCFLADVLDTAYLTVFKYKRGKAAAVIVCMLYVICILLAGGLLHAFMAQ